MKTSFTSRQCYGTFIAPTRSAAVINAFVGVLMNFSPFRLTFRFAVDCYKSMLPHIPHLLNRCGPTDIPFFVMSIYIDTVKTVFGRGFAANLAKKLRIRSKTELNSTPPVCRVFWICGSLAAAFCVMISVIFNRLCISVQKPPFPGFFAIQAAARVRVSAHKISPVGLNNISTFTLTVPVTLARKSDYSQSVENLTINIIKLWVGRFWYRRKFENQFCFHR